MSSNYRKQVNNILKELDINTDSLLDIGGSDTSIIGMLKSCNAKRYAVLDSVENSRGDEFYKHDLNYYQPAESLFGYHRWQTIFCMMVFEYIWNPLFAIMNIYDWLEVGGEAYICFPFIYPIHEPVDIDYLRYTESGIKKLLREPFNKGFSEFDIQYILADENNGLNSFYSLEGMHRAKNIDHRIIAYFVRAVK